jgi:hypothetical protein
MSATTQEVANGFGIDASLRQLRSEARTIQHLLETYLEDWAFISGQPAQGTLLFFIDSHDLKAYIDPDRPEMLSGFMLEAERLNAREQPPQFEGEIKLLSENILSRLLFDPGRQVGLLPSHGEEIDEEIAFHNRNKLRTRLALLSQAGQEAEALRAGARRFLAPIVNDPGDEGLRQQALDYFRRRAPALMALLRDDPASPLGRIDKLVEHSNLVPLSHIDWASLGFDLETCERLRSIRPSADLVDRWRRYLDGRKERRQNSYRSNRIDGEAIATIQQLNEALAALPGPRVAARLVSRAMTLVNATLDRKALERAQLDRVEFLRHPRLVALHPRASAATFANSEAEIDPSPERRLIVALQTYRRHLSAALSGIPAQQRCDAGRESAHDLTRAVRLLVETWKDFETWRIAMAPPPPAASTGDDDSDLRKLIESFIGDPDVMRLVTEELLKSIDRFGSATFSFGTADIPSEVPLLVSPGREGRIYLLPLMASSLGPVSFSATALPLQEGIVLVRNGRELLRHLVATSAERYLGRALILACGQRWNLAEIYTDSAIDVAKLLPPSDARQIADEVRLLRAQVRRLAGSMGGEEGRRAIDGGLQRISTHVDDARVLSERATQILELHLSGNDHTGPDLEAGLRQVEQAVALSEGETLTHIQALSLQLIYDFSINVHRELWRSIDPPDPQVALDHHAALRSIMNELRRTVEDLPHLARAAEIIGFQLPQNDAAGPRPDIAGRLARRQSLRPPLRVPADLRLDSRKLLEALEPASDAITRLVRDELELIVKRIDRQRRRELIYAPVWGRSASGQVLELIDRGPTRDCVALALETLERVAGTSQVVGVGLEDYESLSGARDGLDQAYSLLSALQSSSATNDRERLRQALFHVRMEASYARLLLILISRDDDKQRLRAELAKRYLDVVDAYPEAAIPHFRLNVVLTDIDNHSQRNDANAKPEHAEEAREALERAWQLMRSDPFLNDPDHWIFSTVQRRRASTIFNEAENRCRAWHASPFDQSLRRQFEEPLLEAFRLVRGGFQIPSGENDGSLRQLEATRRANNILFYASRFIVEHAAEDSFARLEITRTQLERLIEFVCPKGVGALSDTGLVHTIGYAYFALGSLDAASEAGERVVALIRDAGDDPHNEGTARLLSDAFTWIRTDEDTLRLKPGAVSRGFAEQPGPLSMLPAQANELPRDA